MPRGSNLEGQRDDDGTLQNNSNNKHIQPAGIEEIGVAEETNRFCLCEFDYVRIPNNFWVPERIHNYYQ